MRLKILTWNISYGYGIGSAGTSAYEPLPVSHFESSLDSMSELIRNTNVDIAFLQEVDFHAKRSHYSDQLGQLARKSGLLYRNECVSWDSPYVPYPGLNPKRQFGPTRSGGGIISRFPIQPVLSELLPKPRENGRLFNWFYLHRYLQMVEIQGLKLCNLHLEAFSPDNRELHLVKLQNRLIDYDLDIAGGDFNGDILLSSEIEQKWKDEPTPEPTYPSINPTDFLDGFVVKKNKFKSYQVTRLESGSVSDHFPLLLELEF